MIAALTQLAIAAGTAAVEALVKLIQRREREPAEPEPEPPHPTWKDLEHQRQQERSAIAHKVKPKR